MTSVTAASNVPICNIIFLPILVSIILDIKLAITPSKFKITGRIFAKLGNT